MDELSVDLSSVVDAIKSASDSELAVLNDISNKLDNVFSHERIIAPPKPTDADTRQTTTSASAVDTNRMGEVELSFDVPQQTIEVVQPGLVSPISDSLLEEDEPTQQAPGAADVTIPESTSQITNIANAATKISNNTSETNIAQVVDHTAGKAIERASISSTSEISAAVEKVSTSVADTVGSAVGNYQELSVNAVNNATENAIDRIQDEASQRNEQAVTSVVKNISKTVDGFYRDASGRLRRKDGRYASAEEEKIYKSSSEVAKENAENKDDKAEAVLPSLRQLTVDAAKRTLEENKNQAVETAGTAVGGSYFYAARELYELTQDAAELATGAKKRVSDLKLGTRFSSLFSRNKTKEEQNNNNSQVQETKAARQEANTNEMLQESSEERRQQVEELIDAVEDVGTDIRQLGNNNGLLGMVGDALGGIDIDRRRRTRGLGGTQRGRLGSVLGRATSGIAETASNAGGLFRNAARVGASGLGRALPFIAPIMATYDAVSGYTDKEKQREIFNLGRDQEATTGQKAATAAGSVLDLGGLVSGGAGLLGSALGFFGFSGAEDTLTFDSGDIARNIYELFGGKVEQKSQSTTQTVDSLVNESDEQRQANQETPAAQYIPGRETISPTTSIVQPTSVAASTSKITSNERASEIIARNQAEAAKDTDTPSTVTLDKDSIDAIGKAVSAENTIVAGGSAGGASNGSRTSSKATASYSETASGSIPNNFSDTSLQRMSADFQ